MSGERQRGQRSLLERMVGRPMPWLAWAWVVIAALWVIIAFTDPSGFHTIIAVVWVLLAGAQIAAWLYSRKKTRAAAAAAVAAQAEADQDLSRDSATH